MSDTVSGKKDNAPGTDVELAAVADHYGVRIYLHRYSVERYKEYQPTNSFSDAHCDRGSVHIGLLAE